MNNIKLQCQSLYDELQFLKECRELHLNKCPFHRSDELIEYLKNDLEQLNKLIEKLEQKLAYCQNA